jgi:hypothetical protein
MSVFSIVDAGARTAKLQQQSYVTDGETLSNRSAYRYRPFLGSAGVPCPSLGFADRSMSWNAALRRSPKS